MTLIDLLVLLAVGLLGAVYVAVLVLVVLVAAMKVLEWWEK